MWLKSCWTFIKHPLSWRRERWEKKQQNQALNELGLCPLPRIWDISSLLRVLIVVPHPDDECLGCGGLIAALRAKNIAVRLILVTDGGGAGGLPEGAAQQRQAEFLRAAAVLGVDDCESWQAVDGAFSDSAAFQARVRQSLLDFAPDAVLLPSPLDYHRDHARIAAALVAEVSRAASVRWAVLYEIWSPLPVTHVLDITDFFAQKMAALACHETALACGDYAAAVEGLNRYRALYLGGAGRFAEAFVVLSREQLASRFSQLLSLRLSLLPWR